MATLFRSSSRQAGVTLTELMIALVLGALVVLAATSMVVTSRGTYRSQDENTRLAESARFGLELGNRLVRLAGYTDFGDDPTTPPPSYSPDLLWTAAPDSYALNGPNIVGSNNSAPGGGATVNGSDSLTIRFFGSSRIDPTSGVLGPDGNILDCAGAAVGAPTIVNTASATAATTVNNAARAYNVLFVGLDSDNEPSLKCQKPNPDGTFATQTLIRGVEDFQVLYGEVIAQGPPNSDLDQNQPASIAYRTGLGTGNAVTDWRNVRSVRIAMLLRSATGARSDPEPTTTVYNLFGAYPGTGSDPGTSFSLATLSTVERTRVRRVVETTVFIRNRMSDWTSVNPP